MPLFSKVWMRVVRLSQGRKAVLAPRANQLPRPNRLEMSRSAPVQHRQTKRLHPAMFRTCPAQWYGNLKPRLEPVGIRQSSSLCLGSVLLLQPRNLAYDLVRPQQNLDRHFSLHRPMTYAEHVHSTHAHTARNIGICVEQAKVSGCCHPNILRPRNGTARLRYPSAEAMPTNQINMS